MSPKRDCGTKRLIRYIIAPPGVLRLQGRGGPKTLGIKVRLGSMHTAALKRRYEGGTLRWSRVTTAVCTVYLNVPKTQNPSRPNHVDDVVDIVVDVVHIPQRASNSFAREGAIFVSITGKKLSILYRDTTCFRKGSVCRKKRVFGNNLAEKQGVFENNL